MSDSIAVEGIVKSFKKLKALDRVTLRSKKGINVILGPNGAGKSTLLRCIDGLYHVDSGTVSVLGENPYTSAEVRKRISLLSDAYGLYDFLTVQQNLRFFGKMYGLGGEETERGYGKMLNALDARRYLNTKVGELSRGTKQKIAFCRSIINDPDILLLDEPTAFLDVKSSNYIREFMLDYAKQGKTIFFVTQKIDEVTRFNSRILIIRNGRIVDDIDSEELYGSILRNSYVNIRLASPINKKAVMGLPGFRKGNADNPTLLSVKIRSYRDIRSAVRYLLDNGAYVVGIDFIEPAIEKLSFGD